jgi:hypothetical protein
MMMGTRYIIIPKARKLIFKLALILNAAIKILVTAVNGINLSALTCGLKVALNTGNNPIMKASGKDHNNAMIYPPKLNPKDKHRFLKNTS